MDTQVKKESDQGNVRCGSSPWQTLSWPLRQTGLRYASCQFPVTCGPMRPRLEDVRPGHRGADAAYRPEC
jgi:hypothetical protein